MGFCNLVKNGSSGGDIDTSLMGWYPYDINGFSDLGGGYASWYNYLRKNFTLTEEDEYGYPGPGINAYNVNPTREARYSHRDWSAKAERAGALMRSVKKGTEGTTSGGLDCSSLSLNHGNIVLAFICKYMPEMSVLTFAHTNKAYTDNNRLVRYGMQLSNIKTKLQDAIPSISDDMELDEIVSAMGSNNVYVTAPMPDPVVNHIAVQATAPGQDIGLGADPPADSFCTHYLISPYRPKYYLDNLDDSEDVYNGSTAREFFRDIILFDMDGGNKPA